MYTKYMPELDEKLFNYVVVNEHAKHTDDLFGVEVELEGRNILFANPSVKTFWHTVQDGSLRKLTPGAEATEYVLSMPLSLATTEKAINCLFKYLNSPASEVYDSYRTSIHVHVNCALETYRTVYNYMVLAILFDELFVSQNGEHRIGNNFCLRAKDAFGQVLQVISSIQSGQNIMFLKPNHRYGSVNFASLLKFGTIEFRSLECTIHEGRVMHWIGTLNELKKHARTYRQPSDIIQEFSGMGAHQFIVRALGPFAYKYKNIPNMEQMLRDGMRIAQDLAFCSAWKSE